MASVSKPSRERDGLLSALNVAIEILNLSKDISSITPTKAVFGSASVLLAMIRDSVANEADFVDLGLFCAEVCEALADGLEGKRLDEIAQSVLRAIGKLTTTVADIQRRIIKLGKRSPLSRLFHARSDKEAIAAWRQQLNSVLHIFNTKLPINTDVLVADMRRSKTDQEGADDQHSAQASISVGETPPSPPRIYFGREEVIEEIISFAENFYSTTLIDACEIGRASIVLPALHCGCVMEWFCDNRWFVRRHESPASCANANFPRRPSKITGAQRARNPEDLFPPDHPHHPRRSPPSFAMESQSLTRGETMASGKLHAALRALCARSAEKQVKRRPEKQPAHSKSESETVRHKEQKGDKI